MSHSSSPAPLTGTLPYELDTPLPLEAIYRDLHANPELAFQEHRTAAVVSAALEALGVRVVTGIGGTGVVGVIENGPGQTVLLRADMDALPIQEQTGLPYASQARGTDSSGAEVALMHACGHDMHTTSLLGAVERLITRKEEWSGTIVALFQPAEEGGGGAQAMIDDGLYERVPRPDIVFGQHLTILPADQVALHPGVVLSAADSIDVTLYGQGGHGSRPHETVDPVLLAASTAVRLNTIVSREVSPFDTAVVSVGRIHAGTKNNIIADEASLGLSVRTFDAEVRERVLGAITRIIESEAAAAGSPKAPTIAFGPSYPLAVNDEEASAHVHASLVASFGEENVIDPGVSSASDDVAVLALALDVPLVFWFVGMNEPGSDAPAHPHHTAQFAPVIEPTLSNSVTAMTNIVVDWLRR